ncbi:PhoX family phosphatase [Microbulbifer salipaludis]|uniref:PhoX family phosphatase n=1 Tax=Microbulbifer salipaludis TaxID=187980 RepID=A0ABS3E5B3_9GAMM|nr:PhoX family phosphatase [Microbulbifer salipaludis]MBN8430467.1 PhoX family phosphatase [Microbulbifer salipaludis]
MTDHKPSDRSPQSPQSPCSPERRTLFKAIGAVTAATAGATLLPGCTRKSASGAQDNLRFAEIPHRLDFTHHVPQGYVAERVLSWGDPLDAFGGDFIPEKLNAREQARRFGYNNDFIAFMPLAENAGPGEGDKHCLSRNSERGLLCVNHEYTQPHLMFSGYSEDSAHRGTRDEHVAIEQQACGHTVVEVEKTGHGWQPIPGSPYNRRLSLTTPMTIVGPAAGDRRLQTGGDPSGTQVSGTVGNCAGGKTPWGTVLIAEEGFGGAFQGDPDNVADETEARNHHAFGISPGNRNWGDYDQRFDITVEPNEPNRFGWMVEYDPYYPQSAPRKLTALGRFEHEGFTLVSKPEQPVVAYGGDDDEHQFVYRFVSHGIYRPGDNQHNRTLLHEGTLYAAQFSEGGSGRWLPLVHGQGPLTRENGFHNQADVLVDARRAAKLLGATPMDRPEDVETNPVNDCTYVMLTKNKQRKPEDVNAANPRARNTAGHVLEIVPPGRSGARDHVSDTFRWNTFLLGGNPNAENPAERGAYGQSQRGTISPHGWFANPDNVAFDQRGNMWIATDGCERFGFHDGLWAMATEGEQRAAPKHFFGCPEGGELCGPEFTPDGNTLFVSVQHPADADNSTFDSPLHRWPDNDPRLPPRPSVLAIRRTDGGTVGS